MLPVKWILLVLGLVLTISTAFASISYSGGIIYVDNSTENLTTINASINDPTVLNQTANKEWLLNASLYVQNPLGCLYINDSDCDILKMKGLPSTIMIRADSGASIFIDEITNITGWNTTGNTDIVVSDNQPRIQSYYNNTLNVTNSYFKHVYIHYLYDKTPDAVNNCTFFESNPSGISSYLSLNKTITYNNFYSCKEHNYEDTVRTGPTGQWVEYYSYTNFSYNYAFGQAGDTMSDNVMIGAGSTVFGNEIIWGGWNSLLSVRDTIFKNNIIHTNIEHNGFNCGPYPSDRYYINNYCYDIYPYSCNYIQVCDSCDPWSWPYRHYIINERATNCGSGFKFTGGYDSYIYNYTSNNAHNVIICGSGNNHIRKSSMNNSGASYGFLLSEWNVEGGYGTVDNLTIIDTTFNNNTPDIYMDVYSGDAIVSVFNTYDETKQPPTLTWEEVKGEIREYVYLDILVQDQNGDPIQGATITIENLNDTNYPAINLTLPPPPPDLTSVPDEPLPLPVVQNLTSLTTNSTGHSLLPNYGWSVNPESTITLMFQKRTNSGTTSGYTYQITVSKNGYNTNNSINVSPDSTWYRTSPDTYQNTTTIVLSDWNYDPTHVYTDVNYRWDSSGNKTIIGRDPLDTDTDLVNILNVVVT